MKWIVGLLSVTAAAAIMAAAAAPSSSGISAQQRYCPPTPRSALASQTPVWAFLDVRTKNGSLVKDVAFAIRRYSGGQRYVVAGWAYSGCWSVLLYARKHVPGQLCITVRQPYKAATSACQKVRSGPSGQKEVRFLLTT